MRLIVEGGCIFDEAGLHRSHGHESLDPVGQEAFVNHLHLSGADRIRAADRLIAEWAAEMQARWPSRIFRVYRVVEADEVTIRFHLVRPGVADWCDQGVEGVQVITVGPEGA